ncbi:MAG: glycosyltransferase family 4 protein [Promethearchaeota archaeon]
MSIIELFRDKKATIDDKFKILLHLLSNPRNIIIIINNIANILPLLKRFNIDIVVGGFPSNTLPLVFLITKMIKKKGLIFTYGNDFLIKDSFLDRAFHFKSLYFKNIDGVIVLGKTTKTIFLKIHKINEEKLYILPLAIFPEDYSVKQSKEELRKKYGISKDTFVILSVGWHVPRKKFDLVMKAIKNIKEGKQDIDIKYFLVGDGISTNYLKYLSEKLGLSDIVQFFGECENHIRNELYKLSDIFVMASVTTNDSIEGFGLVFLEANYYKAPVIGSFSGGIRDAVVNKKTGLLVKPDNIEDLIAKIKFLYENEEKRIKMGENGYNRVISEFLWIKRYSDFIQILDDVMKFKPKN